METGRSPKKPKLQDLHIPGRMGEKGIKMGPVPVEGSVRERRSTWADPWRIPQLPGKLLGWIEGLEKPRLYSQ